MKRILAIAMSATVLMASGLGTFGQTKTSYPNFPFKAAKPLKFSILFSDNPMYPYQKDWVIFKAIKDATNVDLNVLVTPMSEYMTKRSLLISAGDAPYIIPKTYSGQEVPYITSGQILPISDYVNRMPNFSQAVKDWHLESDIETIRQKDGKYYMLPGLHQSYTQDYSLCIRSDIFAKNKITVPVTWDDLEKALKQLKKIYPDIIPFSDRWQLGCTFNIAGPAFGMNGTGIKTAGADWNNGETFYYDWTAKKYVFYPTSPLYKNMLAYFARLVQEGLLDPESATQTDDQATAKFANGKSFVMSCNAQVINTIRQTMDTTIGARKYALARINVPSGPAGGNIVGTRLEGGLLISANAAKDPDFDQLLKFVDWLWYSYDGQRLCKWGIEGKTYKVANGVYSLMPGYQYPAYGFVGSASDVDIRKALGFGSGVFILSYGGPDELAFSTMTTENKDFAFVVSKTRKLLPLGPRILYTEDELEAQNIIRQPLMDYVTTMTYKFVLGRSNLSVDWDEYVKQCVAKGSQRYTDKANEVVAKTAKK
jgi:putative aldouronate transport system substrate-binding protein